MAISQYILNTAEDWLKVEHTPHVLADKIKELLAKNMIKAVSKRRRNVKAKAIIYMGGRCQVCSYDRYQGELDFHHIDPTTKSFGIGSYGHSRSWERVKKELAKCILVCANCHREIESGITQVPNQYLQIRAK